MHRYGLIFVVSLLLLVGCQNQNIDPVVDEQPATAAAAPLNDETGPPAPSTAGNGYPAPSAADSGYPAPAAADNGYPAPYGAVLTDAEGRPTIDPASIITRLPDPPYDASLPVPTPVPGLAVVTGFAQEGPDNPLVLIPVRLARVVYNDAGDAAFVLDGARSPGVLTDTSGRFVFTDIEPQDYVLIIGNVEMGDYEIITETPTTARVWPVSADQVLDTGTFTVDLDSR